VGYWLLLLLGGMLALAAVGFLLGRRRPMAAVEAGHPFHSSPDYYGWYAVIWMFAPALAASVVAAGLSLLGLDMPPLLVAGAWLALPALALWPVLKTIHPDRRARNVVERLIYAILFFASLISILVIVAITLSVLFEALRFFKHEDVGLLEFFTGTSWNPQTSFVGFRGEGAEESSKADPAFGSLPLFAGTFTITLIAMLVAVPVGVLSAVYMSEYAPRGIRKTTKPMLEILAGIPTVVYGFFAAITVSPFIVQAAGWLGLEASYQNALSPGLIMGVMIIPFMSSLTDDVISAVPQGLRRGALALGATDAEVSKTVVLPAALPGIMSAFLLAVSRAVGETMIVVMAAGMSANLTANPLEEVTTVTVQIVAVLVGDQAFDSPQTLSAFGLGLTLLVLTLLFNVVSAVVIRKFRQRYE
jgi:phosphate transport system permease protein